MSAGWEQYITGMLVNKQLPDGNWLQNICSEGALLDMNGVVQACTPGFALTSYKYNVKIDDLNSKDVDVDEVKVFLALAIDGNSKASEAGIRLNKTKYMLAKYDPDKKLAYLSTAGGGACVMASKSVVVFGAYKTSAKMSDGQPQQAGKCNEMVENLAKFLISAGY